MAHQAGIKRRVTPTRRAAQTSTLDGNAAALIVPTSAGTLAGFRAWCRSAAFPERGQIAFIGEGIYIDMSPERIESHVKVKTEISRVIATLVADLDLGTFYADGTRIVNEHASVSNEPDATFASWATLSDGRLRFIPTETEPADVIELEGTPDWVLEIVSPGSVQKDTQQLRAAYHRAGIPEYWLVDARGAALDLQILLHRSRGYQAARQRAGWYTSPCFGHNFRLERRRDQIGQWSYRLHLKPT